MYRLIDRLWRPSGVRTSMRSGNAPVARERTRMSMRVLSSTSSSSIVSPSGNSSFGLLSRIDTCSGTPESFRIVSGMVPSRAVRVSVKVGGVDTWPATAVHRLRRRRRPGPAARRRRGRRAVATRRWRLGRSGSGLSGPTSDPKVSRSARPAVIEPAVAAVIDGASVGDERALGGVAAAVEHRGGVVERARQRHRLEGPAGADRLQQLLHGGGVQARRERGRRRTGPRSAARGAAAPAPRARGSPPGPGDSSAVSRSITIGIGRQRQDRAGGAVVGVGAVGHRHHEGLGERVADDAVGRAARGARRPRRPGRCRRRPAPARPSAPSDGGARRTSPSGATPERAGQDQVAHAPAGARPPPSRSGVAPAHRGRGRRTARRARCGRRPPLASPPPARRRPAPGTRAAPSTVSGRIDSVAGTSGAAASPATIDARSSTSAPIEVDGAVRLERDGRAELGHHGDGEVRGVVAVLRRDDEVRHEGGQRAAGGVLRGELERVDALGRQGEAPGGGVEGERRPVGCRRAGRAGPTAG